MKDWLSADDLGPMSRRTFLKLSGAGLVGLFLLPFMQKNGSLLRRFAPQDDLLRQGRVLSYTLPLYDRPSLDGKLVRTYWRDLVLPITEIAIGEGEPTHNRIWYELNGEGFAHSSNIQPLDIRLNPTVYNLPAGGAVAEVTVPFTDVVWNPLQPAQTAYRLYYSSTYWVSGVVQDDQGVAWYRIPDERFDFIYYARAAHLHVYSPQELAPISPQVPAKDKRLELRLDEQVLVAYEGDQTVFVTRVSSGARFSSGDYATPDGRFITNRKRPTRHMAAGDPANPTSYDLPGVPWVSYLTKSGISFHGTYWHNDFGRPRSHGCVNLISTAALWVYRWTTPAVPLDTIYWEEEDGTQVDIYKKTPKTV